MAGDQPAYEAFLKRVSSMVRGYLMNVMSRALRTEERVEDLVQDVLIAIHRKKHLYRPDLPVLPWLFAIARYRLIDHVRSEKRRPLLSEWEEDFDVPAPETGLTDGRALELEELLAELTPKQREILILAKSDGMPLADIAQRFGMSLSAVKVTVHRAVRKLRSLYEGNRRSVAGASRE